MGLVLWGFGLSGIGFLVLIDLVVWFCFLVVRVLDLGVCVIWGC